MPNVCWCNFERKNKKPILRRPRPQLWWGQQIRYVKQQSKSHDKINPTKRL